MTVTLVTYPLIATMDFHLLENNSISWEAYEKNKGGTALTKRLMLTKTTVFDT